MAGDSSELDKVSVGESGGSKRFLYPLGASIERWTLGTTIAVIAMPSDRAVVFHEMGTQAS